MKSQMQVVTFIHHQKAQGGSSEFSIQECLHILVDGSTASSFKAAS
jgi:hypothetical protein